MTGPPHEPHGPPPGPPAPTPARIADIEAGARRGLSYAAGVLVSGILTFTFGVIFVEDFAPTSFLHTSYYRSRHPDSGGYALGVIWGVGLASIFAAILQASRHYRVLTRARRIAALPATMGTLHKQLTGHLRLRGLPHEIGHGGYADLTFPYGLYPRWLPGPEFDLDVAIRRLDRTVLIVSPSGDLAIAFAS